MLTERTGDQDGWKGMFPDWIILRVSFSAQTPSSFVIQLWKLLARYSSQTFKYSFASERNTPSLSPAVKAGSPGYLCPTVHSRTGNLLQPFAPKLCPFPLISCASPSPAQQFITILFIPRQSPHAFFLCSLGH